MQTRRMSFVEAVANIVVGYGLAVLTQVIVGGGGTGATATAMDTTKKPKEGQQRHFDDSTVEDILKEAGKTAGITQVEVDPSLASIRRKYFEMRDESFIHMGERLAREIGGNFRIKGAKAIMSRGASPSRATPPPFPTGSAS